MFLHSVPRSLLGSNDSDKQTDKLRNIKILRGRRIVAYELYEKKIICVEFIEKSAMSKRELTRQRKEIQTHYHQETHQSDYKEISKAFKKNELGSQLRGVRGGKKVGFRN